LYLVRFIFLANKPSNESGIRSSEYKSRPVKGPITLNLQLNKWRCLAILS